MIHWHTKLARGVLLAWSSTTGFSQGHDPAAVERLAAVAASYRATAAFHDEYTFGESRTEIVFGSGGTARVTTGAAGPLCGTCPPCRITVESARVVFELGDAFVARSSEGGVLAALAGLQGARAFPPQLVLRYASAVEEHVEAVTLGALSEPRLVGCDVAEDGVRIRVTGREGRAVVSVDPATNWLSRIELDFTPEYGPARRRVLEFAFQPRKLARETPMAFRSSGSHECASIREIFARLGAAESCPEELPADLTFVTPTGKQRRVDQLPGKVKVFFVEDLTFPPCRWHMDSVRDLVESFGRRVKFYFVDIGDDVSFSRRSRRGARCRAEAYLAARSLRAVEVLRLDPASEADFVSQSPSTVVVGKRRKVFTDQVSGFDGGSNDASRLEIERALAAR